MKKKIMAFILVISLFIQPVLVVASENTKEEEINLDTVKIIEEAPENVEEVKDVIEVPENVEEVEDVIEVPENVEEVEDVIEVPENVEEVEDVTEVPESVEEVEDVTEAPESVEEVEDVTEAPENVEEPTESTEPTEPTKVEVQEKTIEKESIINVNISHTIKGEEFVKILGKKAREIGQENDIYASVMIAQACLESGFGKSGLSNEPYNNLFGIKGNYEGKSAEFKTWEEYNGEIVNIVDSFRVYPSYIESMDDYVNLIKNGIGSNNNFYKGSWKSETNNYKESTAYLTGKYATDSLYSEKLNQIIEKYELEKYDYPVEYIVKENDQETLYTIAGKHDISVNGLLELNPIITDYNDILKLGDKIILNKDYFTENFINPLKSEYNFTSDFGYRKDPTGYSGNYHGGIDMAIGINTPVYASNAGITAETGFDSSAGNYVIVQHDIGIYTYYLHLNSIKTKVGEKVDSNTVVGLVGSTGNSTGPHLHFAMGTSPWKNFFNPIMFIEVKKSSD